MGRDSEFISQCYVSTPFIGLCSIAIHVKDLWTFDILNLEIILLLEKYDFDLWILVNTISLYHG
jgi:hypothetical protein